MGIRLCALSFLAFMAACGSDKKTSSSTASTTDESSSTSAAVSTAATTASKMAQQTTISSQSQADQSETATSGSDDSSGTTDSSSKKKGGSLQINPDPTIDFNNVLASDFNVALNFNNYIAADNASTNGDLSAKVHKGSNGNVTVSLEGTINQTYPNGQQIHQSCEPNFAVTKQGTKDTGKVVRDLRGIVIRTLESAENPNLDFNFRINHTDTIVTDLYTTSDLTSRTITGTATISDANNTDSAVITFNNVVRPNPSVCLCPTEGSITVALTENSTTDTITNTFNGTCGQVAVSESVSASVAVSTSTKTAATTSSTTAASTQTVVTWDFCTPS